MALSLTAVMIVAALIIDGGQAYAQRRQMQTAADNAALSGANQLYKAKFSGAAVSSVETKVRQIATRTGATTVSCEFITWTGTALGGCNGATTIPSGADGVRVVATNTRNTSFGGFAGRTTQSAPATAAATIQPLVGTGAPFIICALDWDKAKGAKGFTPANLLTAPDANGRVRIDPAKAKLLNDTFKQGGAVKVPIQTGNPGDRPTCGAGSAFKGTSDPRNRFTAPGDYIGENGNGFDAQIEDQVVSAKPCPGGTDVFDGCDILIPVADYGTGNGSHIEMRIVAISVWRVYGDGKDNPKYYGEWLGNKALVSSGQGGTGSVLDSGQPAVIKLIQ